MRSGNAIQGGFAYLLLLAALAVVGVTSAASVSLGAVMARRASEEELLAIGAEYESALKSYRLATPAGRSDRSPRSLDELLRDPRYPALKRHLRKVYVDPLTGSATWGIVRASDGSIAGVYSLAEGVPIKRSGFGGAWATFNESGSYADWSFGHGRTGGIGSQAVELSAGEVSH